MTQDKMEKETLEEHDKHCGCGERAEKEFNLSEQILDVNNVKILRVTSIKEFIKIIKGELLCNEPLSLRLNNHFIKDTIEKHAGDKLITKWERGTARQSNSREYE